MKTKPFCLILALLLALPFSGCGPRRDQRYLRDGKQYGVVRGLFRDRWWNFYERGTSFSDGKFWEEAAADFKKALKQRDRDQRAARTYGMHFVDYFPHRELGIVYFRMGRHREAQKELEASLSTADTGRAKYYLNEVRKALLEASQADRAAPVIRVAAVEKAPKKPGKARPRISPAAPGMVTAFPEAPPSPTAYDKITNRFRLELKGEVEDDTYAHTIEINEKPLFVELSARKIPFSREIRLRKGLNEIRIRTSDLLGKVSEKKIRIYADFEGPSLNIRNHADGDRVDRKRVVLQGALADASGITSLRINDRLLAYDKQKEVEFSFALEMKEGRNRIRLAATDAAGNTTRGELTLTYVPRLARDREPPPSAGPILLAWGGGGIMDAGPGLLAAAGSARGVSAFRINLRDLTDTQTVYYDTLYVDGSVTGSRRIRGIQVNGSPLVVVPGRTIYFNYVVELRPGENRITIEAEDEEGARVKKTVTVVRRVPRVHQVGARMSLAILPFVEKGDVSTASSVVYDNLLGSFVEQERFHVVTRGDEFEAVLREQKLSRTDLVDRGTAVTLGKLVAAEVVLMGTIRETPTSIEIYARLVNTETSSVMEARDVYGQDKSLARIQYLTDGLALKFKHAFPLVEGMVIKVKGKEIYADFGLAQHLKKEMKFIVFREGEKVVHPVTGKVLGSDTEELGVATVVKLFREMSVGKLVAAFDASGIRVQDLVITK